MHDKKLSCMTKSSCMIKILIRDKNQRLIYFGRYFFRVQTMDFRIYQKILQLWCEYSEVIRWYCFCRLVPLWDNAVSKNPNQNITNAQWLVSQREHPLSNQWCWDGPLWNHTLGHKQAREGSRWFQPLGWCMPINIHQSNDVICLSWLFAWWLNSYFPPTCQGLKFEPGTEIFSGSQNFRVPAQGLKKDQGGSWRYIYTSVHVHIYYVAILSLWIYAFHITCVVFFDIKQMNALNVPS